MKSIKEELGFLLKRKSIRHFKLEAVNEETVRLIVDAGQRAPTACSLQTYTVIWIRDQETRRQLMEAMRPSLKAPVFLLICADVRKLAKVMDYLGVDHCLKDGAGYELKLFSIIDASLVAENMTIAAEALGLGSLYLGGAMANQKVADTLHLPEGVLPLMYLCIGYPDERPPLRPRWTQDSILFIDRYRDITEREIEAFLDHMVTTLEEEDYYERSFAEIRRKRTYTFKEHIIGKAEKDRNKASDKRVKSFLKRAGFL